MNGDTQPRTCITTSTHPQLSALYGRVFHPFSLPYLQSKLKLFFLSFLVYSSTFSPWFPPPHFYRPLFLVLFLSHSALQALQEAERVWLGPPQTGNICSDSGWLVQPSRRRKQLHLPHSILWTFICLQQSKRLCFTVCLPHLFLFLSLPLLFHSHTSGSVKSHFVWLRLVSPHCSWILLFLKCIVEQCAKCKSRKEKWLTLFAASSKISGVIYKYD